MNLPPSDLLGQSGALRAQRPDGSEPAGKLALRPLSLPLLATGASQTEVRVAGLVKMSTTDWPGKLAAVVFLQGCPWRCVYCHNEAILDPRAPGSLDWSTVLGFLRRRRHLLDGVVFSGGEPTLDRALPAAMSDVRDLGFEVGLHTGGPWPKRLQALLATGVINWVGLDIKHLSEQYSRVTGSAVSGRAAWAALDVVRASGVAFEVRTTIDPTTHTRADVLELMRRVRALGVTNHVLQEAQPKGAASRHAEVLANWSLDQTIAPNEYPELVRRAA